MKILIFLKKEKKVKIVGLVTINYNRPRTLQLFLYSIDRLRKEFGWFPVVCVSEKTDCRACQKHNVHHIYQENYPVSEKWNTGVRWMMTQEVNYIMIIGSDNIISSGLFRNIINSADQEYDLIGINSLYFYGNIRDHEIVFIPLRKNFMLGPARTIHRSVIEYIDGNICPGEHNSGMDYIMTRTIAPYIKSEKIVSGMLVDIKSRKNIHPINYWCRTIKERSDPQFFYDILSDKELSALSRINNFSS